MSENENKKPTLEQINDLREVVEERVQKMASACVAIANTLAYVNYISDNVTTPVEEYVEWEDLDSSDRLRYLNAATEEFSSKILDSKEQKTVGEMAPEASDQATREG